MHTKVWVWGGQGQQFGRVRGPELGSGRPLKVEVELGVEEKHAGPELQVTVSLSWPS